jgi:hypothetical protein
MLNSAKIDASQLILHNIAHRNIAQHNIAPDTVISNGGTSVT